jgi:hypothetical protein
MGEDYYLSGRHTNEVLVERLDKDRRFELASHLANSPNPPWRPVPSRELARLLGVSLQTLANWRVRDKGPGSEPRVRGKGNRIFYRPDEVASWLLHRKVAPWEICRDWLKERGLMVDEATVESTDFLIRAADPFV